MVPGVADWMADARTGQVLWTSPSCTCDNGRGVAGIYSWEVAETKVDTLMSRAREAGHPLQATIEDA